MRLENWPTLLNDFLEANENVPFKWGEKDCCLFAADAVFVITGIDFGKDYRGKYSNALQAGKLLGGNIEKILTDLGIVNEINIKLAQRGDLVLLDSGQGEALGIINSRGTLSGQGEFGIVDYPLTKAIKAWSIR